MAKGLSLHIGINYLDKSHYRDGQGQPWDGKLDGCENDSREMLNIARQNNFQSVLLLNDQATSERLEQEIKKAAAFLDAGDIFFLSYSGHGSQALDADGDEPQQEAPSKLINQTGGKDETWCLFNRHYYDDELNQLLRLFKPNVRVIVISDSCHSGTIVKNIGTDSSELPAVKEISTEAAKETMKANWEFYAKEVLNQAVFHNPRPDPLCSIILISGCQDTQQSLDGIPNGIFTSALLGVLNDGNFQGNYRDLHYQVVASIPKSKNQTPNYLTDGAVDENFEQQKPFTI